MEEDARKDPENDNRVGNEAGENESEAVIDDNESIKISVVGDSGVGKTCMLKTFVNQKYPDEEDVSRHSLFENTSGTIHGKNSIGTASANSVKFRGIRPRMYIEDLRLITLR